MVDPEYLFKIVLAGDSRVGKTSLRKRYLGQGFEQGYIHTLGAEFASKIVANRQQPVEFQIWDLAGEHTFNSVRKKYYMGATAVIFMFAINDSNSFYNIYNWLIEYFNNTESKKDALFFLIGNKLDLNHERQVQKSDVSFQIKSYESEFKVQFNYLETSALSGQNVDEVFNTIIEKKLQQNH